MMLPRLRGDGPPRSVADLELPLAAVFALTVGLLLMVWLNGFGGSASDRDEIRRVADRPSHIGVRGELAAGAAERRLEATRARVRVRRARAARRAARTRAAAVLASRRAYAQDRFGSRSATGSTSYGDTYDRYGQYVPQGSVPQQQLQVPQRQAPAPQPQPKPRPKPAGGGGGFDDSG